MSTLLSDSSERSSLPLGSKTGVIWCCTVQFEPCLTPTHKKQTEKAKKKLRTMLIKQLAQHHTSALQTNSLIEFKRPLFFFLALDVLIPAAFTFPCVQVMMSKVTGSLKGTVELGRG